MAEDAAPLVEALLASIDAARAYLPAALRPATRWAMVNRVLSFGRVIQATCRSVICVTA
jgi:hypothetical protein